LNLKLRQLAMAVGAAAVGCVLFGCSDDNSSSTGSSAAASADSQSTELKVAPDFTLDKLGGGTVHLAEVLHKNRAVLVNFWNYE
jgi:hypothetical protein